MPVGLIRKVEEEEEEEEDFIIQYDVTNNRPRDGQALFETGTSSGGDLEYGEISYTAMSTLYFVAT
jgi:hypothetical protein